MSNNKKTYSTAPKFSKTGYHTWRSKLNSFLRGRNQAHLVLSTNRPAATLRGGDDRRDWDVKNDIALSHLAETVDGPENRAAERIVLSMTEDNKTAKQIIDALKDKFFIEDNHVRIHAYNQLANAAFLPNEKGVSFISRLEDMKTNIENLGREVDDDTEMLGQLMAAMNKDKRFEITLAAMKTQPLITWSKAVEMISTQIGDDDPTPVEHAKLSITPDEKLTCQICGKRNHSAKKCHFRYKRQEDPKPDKNSAKKKKDKANITCFRCQKKGHYSNECPDKQPNKRGAGMSGWDEPKESANMTREEGGSESN